MGLRAILQHVPFKLAKNPFNQLIDISNFDQKRQKGCLAAKYGIEKFQEIKDDEIQLRFLRSDL